MLTNIHILLFVFRNLAELKKAQSHFAKYAYLKYANWRLEVCSIEVMLVRRRIRNGISVISISHIQLKPIVQGALVDSCLVL